MRMKLPMAGAVLSAWCAGCGGGTQDTTDAGSGQSQVEPKFSAIQQKIFLNSCATSSCHSPSGKAGNLDLTAANAYAQLLGADGKGAPIPDSSDPGPKQAAADGYVLVKPGDPDKSFLVMKLNPQLDTSKYGLVMPAIAGFTLDAQQIQAISDWIKNGAQND